MIAAAAGASPVTVRDAVDDDLPRIHAIYAHHVLHGLASFEETPPEIAELARRRADIAVRGLPFVVAEMAGRVRGYAYAAPYRARSAYRHTVEDSVYVAPDAQGRGVGRAALAEVIARCERLDVRQMVAIIGDSGNAASIRLHERLGFRHVGTLGAVGFKFGQWVDSVIMQRSIGPSGAEPPPR
jgi:phosphinothricin acetyltransferase